MLLLNLSEKQRFLTALSELNETEITKAYSPFSTWLAIQSKSETKQDDMTDYTDPFGLLLVTLFFSKWPQRLNTSNEELYSLVAYNQNLPDLLVIFLLPLSALPNFFSAN